MKKLFFIPVLVAGILLIFSCDPDRRCLDGNGNYITEVRNIVGTFSGIEMDGSFNVYVKKDSIASVEVDADQNIQKYIITRVRSNRLLIESEKNCFDTDLPINIYVTMPYADYIILDGSGYIEVDSLDAQKVIIELNGSGEIFADYIYTSVSENYLTGSGYITLNNVAADEFNAEHDGSGTIEVRSLFVNDVYANLDGSGEIEIYGIDGPDYMAHRITATIGGSGNIELEGYADNTKLSIEGSGNIKSFRLYQNDCNAYISGSGSIYVFVYDYLDVNIPGSGIVFYRGRPAITLYGSTRIDQVLQSN